MLSRDKASSLANLEALNVSIKIIDYELLETDPEIRPTISNYHLDIQNKVRKIYLKMGHHQPPHNLVYHSG